ncbi:MAG: hypothetical protein AAGJ81_06470 [Verrucomicrobiota bacterium]
MGSSLNPTSTDEEKDYSFEVGFFEDLSRRNSKDLRVLEVLAHYYTKSGRVGEGLRVDRRIVRQDPDNPVAHYNLACSLALRNRKKEAVESLENAIKRGYRDISWMLNDEDLKNLREYRPFVVLIERVRKHLEGGVA